MRAESKPSLSPELGNRLLLITFLLGLFFTLISISLTQMFLGLNALLWLILLFRHQRQWTVPSFFWPLLVYAGLSLLASSLSVNPELSFRDSRELLIYLLIPAVCATLQSRRSIDLAGLVLLASGFVNLVYSLIVYFGWAQQGSRLRGFMGHYMTEAGLLMLYIIVSLSHTLFSQGRKRWLWAGLAAGSGFLLLLTLTRSAWLGLAAAIIFLLAIWKPVSLVLVPFLLTAVFFLSPYQVKRRVLNTFNLYSPSNRERIEYLQAGLRIIGDYPFFGTGPDTVDMVFQNPKYGLSAEARQNVHLHNNLLQIAAERGLPTLAVWLIFMGWSFWLLLKKWKGKQAGALPWIATGLASVLALFISGLFEYNFADSEITMLFLILLTIPFVPAWEKEGGRRQVR